MYQQDYKAIAEIIKKNFRMVFPDRKSLVMDLADYFEKEELERLPKRLCSFDKKQFLKDCGLQGDEKWLT